MLPILPLALLAQTGVTSTLKWYPGVTFKLGDGFVATGTTKITVKLVGNDASDSGRLSFLDPVTGQERALFKNKDAAGTSVDLGAFPKGAPIVFKYVNLSSPNMGNEYTGANAAGTYDFDADPALKGLAVNHRPMPVSDSTNKYGNHQWAVSARINDTDVAFGFEDNTLTHYSNPKYNSDMDFNDIGFVLTGVLLVSEVKLSPPTAPTATNFTDTFQVALTPPTGPNQSGAKLFYTTDGSAPQVDSAGNPVGATKAYTGPFTIDQTTTVKVVAWKAPDRDPNGAVTVRYTPSDPVSVTYTKLGTLSAPVANPPGRSFPDSLAVTLTQPQGATIYYVLCDAGAACPDPGAGSTPYSAPIKLTSSKILKAVGVKAGSTNSPVLTEQYTKMGTLARPVATPPGQSFEGALEVALSQAQGAPIHYRVCDTGAACPDPDASSPTYAAAPIHLEASAVLKAVALQDGWVASPVLSETYLRLGTLDKPVATPAGRKFQDTLRVTLAQAQGAPIHYVLCDQESGCSADSSSPVYSGPIVLTTGKILKAVAGKPGYTASPVLTETYVLAPPADISVRSGDYAVGSPVPTPAPLKIPVTVTVPRGDPAQLPVCVDCATGEWKATDPARPQAFPIGPELHIATQRPFDFDISFFTNLGTFVNRAQGRVTEAMLQQIHNDSAGYKRVSLMWYPVDVKGQLAGTGVYVAKGTLRTAGADPAPGGAPASGLVDYASAGQSVLVRMGYVRKSN